MRDAGWTRADYVIVGAGSAGCVLANRLSADPATSVILIESGAAARDWIYRMPAALAYPLAREAGLWRFETEPEPGLGGRRIGQPRGRLLGGSSAINGMMFVRGHPLDFDDWAARGASGWDYASVLQSFRAIETFSAGGDAWRGARGPLRVRRSVGDGVLDRAFRAATVEAGYGASADLNGARLEGAVRFDQTIDAGQRVTSATAFLDPVRARRNLAILTRRTATGLIIERGRATGVRCGRETFTADRAVILAAGAIGSPHLLLLSGIGPAGALRSLGIETRADRRGVGAGLHDHPDIIVRHACREPVSLHALTSPPRKVMAGLRWFATGTGPGATNHFESGAFIRSEAGRAKPDLQLSFLPLALSPGSVQSDTSIGEHGFQVHVDLLSPESRGTLSLRSADPAIAPALRFNYLGEPADTRRLQRALEHVREILSRPAMRRYLGRELTPGPETRGAAVAAWLRDTTDTAYHPVGTCRMGAASDDDAVVDEQGRVIGVDGLRVADASVMPAIVSGNTNAATMMIADRIAGLVLGEAVPPLAAPAPWQPPLWTTRQREHEPMEATS